MLIEAGIDPKLERPELGLAKSALGYALQHGDVFLAELLLNHGVKGPPGRDMFGADLLVAAAYAGNLRGVQTLLSSGVDVNAVDNSGRVALAAALDRPYPQVADLLLRTGADSNLAGANQHDPLNLASGHGLIDLTKSLIGRGAQLNRIDRLGAWPLREAVRTGAPAVVRSLLDAGASANLTDAQGRTVLHDLIGELAAGDPQHRRRIITDAHLQIVAMLKAAGLSFSATDRSGHSVISSAIGEKESDLAFLAALITLGSPIIQDDLFTAVQRHNLGALKLMVERGGNPNAVRGSQTLLEEAFYSVPEQYVNGQFRYDVAPALFLLGAGATLPADSEGRARLLELAIKFGSSPLVAELLHRGIPAQTKVNSYEPAAEYALTLGEAEILTLLLESGADQYALDSRGDTMLHRLVAADLNAAKNHWRVITPKHVAAISALVGAGFDLTVKNQDGRTVAGLAAKRSETEALLDQGIGGCEQGPD